MNKITKTETESFSISIDFSAQVETVWRPGYVYSLSDYVRPTLANGYEYECTSAGQTASREPVWDTTVAGTTTDGSVEWTTRAFSTNAEDTISTVNVSATTGITVGSGSIDGAVVSFNLSGGTNGNKYTVSVEVTTTSGAVLESKVVVIVSGS